MNRLDLIEEKLTYTLNKLQIIESLIETIDIVMKELTNIKHKINQLIREMNKWA